MWCFQSCGRTYRTLCCSSVKELKSEASSSSSDIPVWAVALIYKSLKETSPYMDSSAGIICAPPWTAVNGPVSGFVGVISRWTVMLSQLWPHKALLCDCNCNSSLWRRLRVCKVLNDFILCVGHRVDVVSSVRSQQHQLNTSSFPFRKKIDLLRHSVIKSEFCLLWTSGRIFIYECYKNWCLWYRFGTGCHQGAILQVVEKKNWIKWV